MNRIILFGNGQVASNAYYLFKHDSPYEVAAFTVDNAFIGDDTLHGLPVVAFEEVEKLFPPGAYHLHVAISFRQVNRLRAQKYDEAKKKGYQLVSSISSHATVWPDLVIGDNCRIGPQSSIDPYAQIGSNVTIASGCLIGHHAVIGDHCFLAAGVTISGSTVIEPYTFIGAGATIRDRLTVREACVIGAGAVIVEDTRPGGVYLAPEAETLPIDSHQLPLG